MANKSKDNAPQGRSLWGSPSSGSSIPESTEQAGSVSPEERKAAKQAARAQKAEAGKAKSKHMAKAAGQLASAPFRRFKAASANNPLRTWGITAGLLIVVAFGSLQVVNVLVANPQTSLDRYLEAVRDADTSAIESLEFSQPTEVEWAPMEVLKESRLPEVSATELTWSPLSSSATATVSLDDFESNLKFTLTRVTEFGITGWSHTWLVESDPIVVSFELDGALDPSQQLVVGENVIGVPADESVLEITGKEFRALPGLFSIGVAPNGFIGGPTEVYELTPGSTQTMTFMAGGIDQALVDRATELATQSLVSQFDACLASSCGVLDNNWDDYYLSWTLGDPPEYWEGRTASDSLTSGGCELVVEASLNGPLTVDYVFMCGYTLVRDAEWLLGDGYTISDQGTIAIGRGIGISVSASADASELTPGAIRYVPYGTD